MPWFFSYAEFGPEAIHKMLQKAPFCSLPAVVANHQVTFRGRSRKWGGGFPTLDSRKGCRVFGAAHLLTTDELARIEKFYKEFYKTKAVTILLDVTQDKFPATTFVLNADEPVMAPSDDLTKEIIKNLKFFWGQDNGKTPTLEDFGIMPELGTKTLKKVKK